jgi:acyl-CoA synthetase (AMP-forming)/AMP-acid ligase II
MQDAGARFVVGDAHLRLDEIIDAGSEAPVELDLDETAPFHLRYTSGTTGKPKASLNTHRSLALFQMGTAVEFGVSEEEVHLAMASLTHAAIYFIHTVIYAGGTTVLKPAFDPNTIWEDCQRYRVTSTLVVPTILAMALDAPGEASTLRNVVSLGAPLATRLKERFADRFPHVGLHEMYGATELSMVTNLRPHDQLRKPRSVGQPRFGYALGIFDDDGNELPRGHVGTIYARGRSTHAGYVGAVLPDPPPPKLTAEGWVTVGDLGHIDDDGFLFISDRRSDLILSGGMNVYPSEVEDRLMRADGVREAAVVGLADDKWGRRVTACIVGSASAQDLDSWCRKHLANYKVPRSYVFLHELPKSPAGKVLRRELINQLESNIGRGGACGDSVSKKPR